jgi:hypothetical protein
LGQVEAQDRKEVQQHLQVQQARLAVWVHLQLAPLVFVIQMKAILLVLLVVLVQF